MEHSSNLILRHPKVPPFDDTIVDESGLPKGYSLPGMAPNLTESQPTVIKDTVQYEL